MNDTGALVTGATGLIGPRLVKKLGTEVAILSRDAAKAERTVGVKAYAWDGRSPIPEEALEGVGTIFHLAGEPVAGSRWTDAKKARIRDSRVLGTRALVASIAGHPIDLVCASAVGIYGSRGDEVLDEESAPGDSFLADVCKEWEAEANAHTGRVVTVRIGVVLAKEGGALGTMLPLFRTGVAGRLGDGKQWMPWIHVDDLVALLLHAVKDSVSGPLCGAAPEPVTNATFTKVLGKVLHRPTVLAAPAFAMRLALGEMAEIVLASQRVVPKKAESTGFTFTHRELEGALRDLLAS